MAEDTVPTPAIPDEEATLRKFSRAESAASVLNTLIKYAGLFGIFYWVFRSVEVLAGETTVADFGVGVRLFASVRVSQLVAWALAGMSVAYGLGQRTLRRKTIERLQGRITVLEAQIDPGRTSSRLSSGGETRPEDEI